MLTYAYLADLDSLPNGDCITEASADLKSGTYPTGGEKGLGAGAGGSGSLHAYVSIRQHTSAYVRAGAGAGEEGVGRCTHTSAYVSIRQHTSAYVSIRQHASAYVSIRQHTSAYVSIRADAAELAALNGRVTHAGPALPRDVLERARGVLLDVGD